MVRVKHPPSPLSFFLPHTYPKGTQRVPYWIPKGDYFYSPQSSSIIKKKWRLQQHEWTKESRSVLDPIGRTRSPFVLLWNLHKVELFSAFISHLDDISSWKCSWKSLQFKRKKIGMKGVRIGSGSLVLRRTSIPREPLDHYGFLGWWGNNLTTYSINLNPKKNLTSF